MYIYIVNVIFVINASNLHSTDLQQIALLIDVDIAFTAAFYLKASKVHSTQIGRKMPFAHFISNSERNWFANYLIFLNPLPPPPIPYHTCKSHQDGLESRTDTQDRIDQISQGVPVPVGFTDILPGLPSWGKMPSNPS